MKAVRITKCVLYSRKTGHWSHKAVITVSNAPKIDPSARNINIAKNNAAKRFELGNFVTISGYATKASPTSDLTTSKTFLPDSCAIYPKILKTTLSKKKYN